MSAILWGGLVVLGLLAMMSIKIVPEYQRLVLFRLGACKGQLGPGLVLIIPMIDQVVMADLREIYLEIPSQTCITRDNAPIGIDFLIYLKVTNPVNSVVQVRNFAGAAQGIAMTTLRAVVGDILLDDVLAKREEINTLLRTKLDEVTERWGVKVTTVEIREIDPPKDVQDAMNKQMAAERTRRAIVLEADGKKQYAITVAEGDRQSKILSAEGDRQAEILKAEGHAKALENIFAAAKLVDDKTISLQYLETLKVLGQGAATKYIFPMEFVDFLKPIAERIGRATVKS
ncbi:MAG: SPFH/Band 7/PHB domain protein [Candidatus Firestonebacteria bacterium]|nr:SPFH/Band 7/PHB domain protein [Candidatus Firestonebacteria bacterium]